MCSRKSTATWFVAQHRLTTIQLVPPRSRWILAVGCTYIVALAVVGLWPTHVDEHFNVLTFPPIRWALQPLELSAAHAYGLVEFCANILWFAPFGILMLALRRGQPWLSVILAGALISTTIEILQAVARPDRTASVRDVVANTLGAALGCLLYLGVRWRRGAG